MNTPGGDWAIDLREVEKNYGRGWRRVAALRGIGLQVRAGEIFGLLGPNGAGKSTLVKIMMTVVHPTRASGTILGRPVGDKATLARIGYLPEHHRLPGYLNGRQLLETFGALAGLGRAVRRRRAEELLETVGMAEAAHRKVGTYSKGMMQRVGVAQALMANPDLVVLDEPTDGVDPLGRRDIRVVLARLREQGRTVFVNSHLLGELEMICDRVAILVQGQVARQGTLAELAAKRRWYEMDVLPGSSLAAAGAALGARQVDGTPVWRGQWGGVEVELKGLAEKVTVRVETADAYTLQGALDALRGARCVVGRIELVQPSLEELFIEAVNEQGGASGDGQGGRGGGGDDEIMTAEEVRA